MGVRKFRSVADMPGPAPRPALDPENLRLAFDLSSAAMGFAPTASAPGLRKFRSWAELVAFRDDARRGSASRSGSRST